MKLLKKINNNYALALDSKGEEIIVSGRGIGFQKMPCELKDLSLITRTYYDLDSKYIGLLSEISDEIIQIATKTVDLATGKLKCKLNPNLVLTLADHINFSIKRYQNGIIFDYPLTYDFIQMYKTEVEIARYALDLIYKYLDINLPEKEATGIAMNIINGEITSSNKDSNNYDELINKITYMIEKHFEIEINKESVNFSRYATHLRYLFNRVNENKMISSDNLKIYESLKLKSPDTYECVIKIKEFLAKEMNWSLDEEELLYLILHVNRLCIREDCNR